jgi:uracil-DNA glycosylase family 4
VVPGEGKQPAAGLICGEAPGRDEVKAGRPFVGKSGKLLDTALRSFGIAREDIFITNVVKDLPLDSDGRIRRPYDEEIEAWRSILEGEIQHTAPKAILALGKTAWKALTDTETPDWAGGRLGIVFGAYHPSYVLRSGNAQYAYWLSQMEPWAKEVQS